MNKTRARDTRGKKAPAAAKLDAEIARLVHVGYIACGVLVAVMLTTLGWMALAPRCGLTCNVVEQVGWALSAAVMVCLLVTFRLAGRPVQRRTKYDLAMMFFVVWFFAIFGIAAPTFCIGSVVCLVVSIKRFKGTLGAAVITLGERSEGGDEVLSKSNDEAARDVPFGDRLSHARFALACDRRSSLQTLGLALVTLRIAGRLRPFVNANRGEGPEVGNYHQAHANRSRRKKLSMSAPLLPRRLFHVVAVLSFAGAAACDPGTTSVAMNDAGVLDANVTGPADAGDAASSGDGGPSSGACDATGTMVVAGERVVQLSADDKIAVTRGRLVAPDGSKLVTTVHATRGATTNRAFFVGTPGCTGLCYADPQALAQDGTLRATVVPGAPAGIEVISTTGTGGGAIVLASNVITEVGTGGPTDATFAANGLWSGSIDGRSYTCGTPKAFSASFNEALGQPTFDFYFVADCLLPTTSASVYGHVSGSYTKGAGHVRTTYEILGSNESSAKRYAVLGFERLSRPEPFFPYGEGLTVIGALHLSGGAFVFDTNDFAELCDPTTGSRTKIPPYR